MRFGFTQAVNVVEYFEELNKISIPSLTLLIIAIACGIASIYTPYTSTGKQIDTCLSTSEEECQTNMGLSWSAAVFGIIGLIIMTSALGMNSFGIAKTVVGFLEKVLKTVANMKLAANAVIMLALILSLAAIIVQSQSVGVMVDDKLQIEGQEVGEHNVAFWLSLVSVLCYFLVSGLMNADSFMSFNKVQTF